MCLLLLGVAGSETEPSAIGIGWATKDGKWEYLSQFGEADHISGKLESEPKIEKGFGSNEENLRFTVRYHLGDKSAVKEVVEEYLIEKAGVTVKVRSERE
jgi:hypothetical protein